MPIFLVCTCPAPPGITAPPTPRRGGLAPGTPPAARHALPPAILRLRTPIYINVCRRARGSSWGSRPASMRKPRRSHVGGVRVRAAAGSERGVARTLRVDPGRGREGLGGNAKGGGRTEASCANACSVSYRAGEQDCEVWSRFWPGRACHSPARMHGGEAAGRHVLCAPRCALDDVGQTAGRSQGGCREWCAPVRECSHVWGARQADMVGSHLGVTWRVPWPHASNARCISVNLLLGCRRMHHPSLDVHVLQGVRMFPGSFPERMGAMVSRNGPFPQQFRNIRALLRTFRKSFRSPWISGIFPEIIPEIFRFTEKNTENTCEF